jgi:hypothetical protein
MREYTRYAVQELVQPFEFEKIVSELLFNLSQDTTFSKRNYPDIRYIGGTKDFGYDAISITWIAEEKLSKTIFAFSKRKDWKTKLNEDLNKHKTTTNIKSFVFITTEKAGSWKLPEKVAELAKSFKFIIEIIDIEDIVIWLDNTPWGKSIKRKYCIDSDDVFVYLKSYKIALQSDEETEEFFRIKGPIEIDFIKGLVIRRNEVDSIIKKLKDNRIHIIFGPPASGKTVLTRNICYELNGAYNIYWLEMDDLLTDRTRVYLEIQRLNRTNSMIIVENGHKSIEKLEELIDYFIDNISTVKMIITTININNKRGRSRRIAQLIDDENYNTKIIASDIAEKLVSFYSDKLGKRVGKDINKFLYYKDDLWLLSYLLKAYIDKDELDDYIIFQRVKDDLIEYNECIGIGASDIILLVSWITQNSAISSAEYEDNSNHLPIDDFFLIDRLGYDPAVVSSLVKLGIIKKTNDSYWCWHMSLSKIYLKTAEIFPDMMKRINLKFREMLGDYFDNDYKLDKNINVFNVYLLIHPEYVNRILNVISESMLLLFKWQNILNNLDTRDLIYTNLRKGDLDQICSIVHLINNFSHSKNKELVYKELIDELGPDTIRDKICRCRNSKQIVSYAYLFFRIDKNIGIKIINNYKDNIIKYLSEITLGDIEYFLEFLFRINPHFAEEIIKVDRSIDRRLISANLSDVTWFFCSLNNIQEMERTLYPQRDTNWLHACVDFLNRNWRTIKSVLERDKKSESIRTILSFISHISKIDICKGREAGNIVGHAYLISHIDEINGLNELRYSIFSIENIYPELKDLILAEFVVLIESEISANGVLSMAHFFGCLFKDSKLHKNEKETIIQLLHLMDKDIIETMKQSSIYPYYLIAELGI